MASPVLPQRTYRLSQIPEGTTPQEIRQLFPSHVRDAIQYLSLANALGSTAPDNQVSTVTFETEPPILATLPYKYGSLLSALVCDVQDKFSRVWIDAHFHGFTTINNPADEHEAVDIIAVTGLGGKAFASWQCYDGSMWLRDHVPQDISNSRISIYGYSSDVGNSNSISTLSEMTETFIMDLVNYRRLRPGGHMNRTSPLFLMGHSTGGIIIKDAWCRCADSASPSRVNIHRSIYGLVFFGTPHNGMSVTHILPGLAGQPSENLVRDIEPGSTYIKALKERFSRATKDLRIISCYELRQTPRSEFLPDGSIVRSGKLAMNAPESSACLYWANEVRVPINDNHSMIAKLAKREGSAYQTVVTNLSQLVIASRMGIPIRFLPDANISSEGHASETRRLVESVRVVAMPEEIKPEQCFLSDINAKHACSILQLGERPVLLAPPPGFELNRPPSDRQVRVYVHGAWDMFHYGHARFLKFAKQAIPNAHLMVGVTGDEDMRKFKGATVMSGAERAEVVRACKYVDEVIEDCPPILLPEFAAHLQIDYFGCSEESLSMTSFDPYKFLKLQGKAFVIPRTQTISSMDILARVIRDRDVFIEKQVNNGVTRAQLNI